MSCRRLLPLLSLAMALTGVVRGDGPADNVADRVRPVPPKGIAVPDADRAALQAGVDELGKEIDALRDALKGKPDLLELLPDVQIYHNAVRYALAYDEFFNVREVAVAKKLLEQGMERAGQLREGKAPWNTATGLVVRGYVSKIDGSVQPYGLVVPASYQPEHAASVPARRLVPRPRREPERAELHRRPADVARRVHAAERVRRCIPTAATATPTSLPARSTCSRRSTTSRSTTRSTRTAW